MLDGSVPVARTLLGVLFRFKQKILGDDKMGNMDVMRIENLSKKGILGKRSCRSASVNSERRTAF